MRSVLKASTRLTLCITFWWRQIANGHKWNSKSQISFVDWSEIKFEDHSVFGDKLNVSWFDTETM